MKEHTTRATVTPGDSTAMKPENTGTNVVAGDFNDSNERSLPRRITNEVSAVWQHIDLSAFVAASCLALWMLLFVCGTFTGAADLIQGALASEASVGAVLRFMAGVASWTWTNLLMLCVLSAFLGGIARAWNQNLSYSAIQFDALTTGFVIFMLFMFEESIMGHGLATGADPDPQAKYMRLVIISSLLSFVASYHPAFHKGLLARFTSTQMNDMDSDSGTPTKPR